MTEINCLILPWCGIESQQRWFVNSENTIHISRNSTSSLAKSYECMRTLLADFAANRNMPYRYSSEDIHALQKLRKKVIQKYERYCEVHCILWRIFEIFVGLFRGYSYKSSCRRLVNEIDSHLHLARSGASRWQRILDKDVFQHIVSYLPQQDVRSVEETCYTWREMAVRDPIVWRTQFKHLEIPIRIEGNQEDYLSYKKWVKLFSGPNVLGPADWKKHYGNVGEVPELPNNIEEILESDCPYFNGKKMKDTHLLVLHPSRINNVPFPLNDLISGVFQIDVDILEAVEDDHGETTIEKSYWFLITKTILPHTRGKSYQEQLLVLDAKHYNAPHVMEAASAIVLYFLKNRICLLGNVPHTFTHCQEITTGWHLMVGKFIKDKLRILCAPHTKTLPFKLGAKAGMCGVKHLERE